MNRLFIITPIFALFLLLAACSNAGNDPLTGDMSPDTFNPKFSPSGIPIIEPVVLDTKCFYATGILGAYEIKIDPISIKAELNSKRFGSIGESYIVSGISYFTTAPCSDCLKIKSISLTSDLNIQLTFRIKHPFEPGDPYKPPTARNRLDLDIFDVALLVRPIETTPSAYPLTASGAYAGVLVDADGYTRELSDVLSDDNAIPYALVIDDNDAGSSTYNEFPMGAETLFDVIFDLPNGGMNFELYLTMGYGASAKKSERLVPKYYNPEFNRKSAWKVVVTPPQGDNTPEVGNTWQDNDPSTTYNVTVEVYDWQIGANVNPELAEQTDVYASSEVSSVSVEISGMTDALPSTTNPASGTGTPSDPLVFMLPIANENLLEAGEYTGLVKVSDERIPGESIIGGETDTLAHSPNGVTLEWHNIPEFATYQTFTATVVVGCGPITGLITTPTCPKSGVASGSNIDFSATASSGNGGGPVVLYEWDKDYDGIPANFNTDATGQNVTLGPFINPNCGTPPETPVTYTAAVRGTDSCNPPNVTVFATCEVTVDSCLPPSVGNITIKVNRTGSNYIIDAANPFTLQWAAPGGTIAEYAIYKDNDPSDGLTNNLVFVATTTLTTWTDNVSGFPSNRYIIGWTYIVRARSVAGNPSSEGADSEPAFVTTNGWETLNMWQNPGEGWSCNQETPYPEYYNRPYVFGEALYNYEGVAEGQHCVRSSPFCGGDWMTWAGRWNGLVKQTPTVPNSTVRFLDFSLYIYQMFAPQGMILGTCPYAPGLNWTTTQDLEWASAKSTDGYWGYNTDSEDAKAQFGDVPNGTFNAWINGFTSDRRKLVGGDVNINANPTDPYVGIEWIKLDSYAVQQYPFIDEMAIAVY